MKRKNALLLILLLVLVMMVACKSNDQLDFSDLDYDSSYFKHINNGGIEDSALCPRTLMR